MWESRRISAVDFPHDLNNLYIKFCIFSIQRKHDVFLPAELKKYAYLDKQKLSTR